MTCMFSDLSSRVGMLVGSYRIVRFIGAGGMGEVYEVCHAGLGTRHAIKFLRRELVRRPDLYARFEQEARIAGTLNNRHIVKVREFRLADDGMPYMVMDLAEGRSLASILAEQSRLSVARAVDLIHQACVGLGVAHAANVVHRDLKPDNLYVCPQRDGTELLKVLDFGIAKYLGSGDSGPTTETGSNLGTAYYMSPEQAQGARHAVDYRTDIYALGVILYELVSGKRPHEGHSYNEILIRIVTQRPIPLDEVCPNLSRELVNVVHRAMARVPADRFQSALDFAQSLDRLRNDNVEWTGAEISLQPAVPPRSPDFDTLASGTDGLPTATASAARNFTDVQPTTRRELMMPGKPRTRWLNLGLQFFYAILFAAGLTSAGLWLWAGRAERRASSPTSSRAPRAAALPTARPADVSATTSHVTSTTAIVATTVTRASTKPSGRTSIAGQIVGQSGEGRQTLHGANEQAQERVLQPEPALGPKPPTIDDPLPPSPHAPGVSPVME